MSKTLHLSGNVQGLYIKDKNGQDFDGFCWPGSSSYLDFTSGKVRQWWAEQFALDKYTGSTMELYTWNDMNEPSVFNGPEVSMQKVREGSLSIRNDTGTRRGDRESSLPKLQHGQVCV